LRQCQSTHIKTVDVARKATIRSRNATKLGSRLRCHRIAGNGE
jgi:hypothetical protein